MSNRSAQGIETEGRDAQRLGAKPESPVAEGDAPKQSDITAERLAQSEGVRRA